MSHNRRRYPIKMLATNYSKLRGRVLSAENPRGGMLSAEASAGEASRQKWSTREGVKRRASCLARCARCRLSCVSSITRHPRRESQCTSPERLLYKHRTISVHLKGKQGDSNAKCILYTPANVSVPPRLTEISYTQETDQYILYVPREILQYI